jgi:hypothetical protein
MLAVQQQHAALLQSSHTLTYTHTHTHTHTHQTVFVCLFTPHSTSHSLALDPQLHSAVRPVGPEGIKSSLKQRKVCLACVAYVHMYEGRGGRA